MKDRVDLAIIEYEKLITGAPQIDSGSARSLHDHMIPVQTAYVGIIEQALRELAQANLEQCRDILRDHRSALEPARERIGEHIQQGSHAGDAYLMLVLEFLYSRSRLIEELQMFPTFGLSLLERYTIEQSIDETIAHFEEAMAGNRGLFDRLQDAYESLDGRQA